MSKRVLPATLFVLGLLLGSTLGAATILQYYTLDGIWGWFFASDTLSRMLGKPFEDTTEYACGYSDYAFGKVRVGMSGDEVVALLGLPLEVWQIAGTREGWRWSRSRRDKSYRVRAVVFSNGKVAEVSHLFYLD